MEEQRGGNCREVLSGWLPSKARLPSQQSVFLATQLFAVPPKSADSGRGPHRRKSLHVGGP